MSQIMNVITYSVCDYDEYSGKKTDVFSAYKKPNVAFFSETVHLKRDLSNFTAHYRFCS